ncbi:hypothetical protein ACQ86D_22005 [Streptomyces galilaeus]
MLRRLLPGHEVRHVSEIKWAGKKDLALLPDATRRGFEAFLTKDGRQLEDPRRRPPSRSRACTTSGSVMATRAWWGWAWPWGR